MRHGIWVFPSERFTGRSKNTNLRIREFALLVVVLAAINGCGVYSFSGAATSAKTISVEPFFNNTDLAPANIGATFTNKVKDYYQQNSSLRVIESSGELHIEGIVSDYRINAMAPVSTGNPNDPNTAALSRLTIAVRVTFEDSWSQRITLRTELSASSRTSTTTSISQPFRRIWRSRYLIKY